MEPTTERNIHEQDLLDLFRENGNSIEFARYFRQQKACWRCILMMLKISGKTADLSMYRMSDE